jgi:hypothetical protein
VDSSRSIAIELLIGRENWSVDKKISCTESVPDQKLLWICATQKAVGAAIWSIKPLAEEDPFPPYAGPSYYAAVGVVDRARVSR